ncbi:MAG: hypothetical protein Q8910_00440 [Bacteroidota bacterium]|nr:hypothetical protein [Bacteroidota bacterium]
MFNKLLKKYGTTVNIHYTTKDAMGKPVLPGADYLGVKVFIDPTGVGLNYDQYQYGNIKSSKAVFYIPLTYLDNGVETALNFRDESGKAYPFITFSLLDNSFKWELTAINPIVTIGNEALYQVGVQQ